VANTITGLIKILYKNYMLGLDVNTTNTVASTGDITYSYDNDPTTRWESVGSDDTTTETLTYYFDNAQSINRLFAMNMNWKDFNIQYWNGSTYANFTNVYSVKADSSPASSILYTANTAATRYWEFDNVSTTRIRAQVLKTFVVDDEKELYEIYIGKEVGTFTQDMFGKPSKVKINFEAGSKEIKLSNQSVYQLIKGNKININLSMKNMWESADQSIVETMFDLRECAISLCGADGTQYTKTALRLQDLYNCVVTGELNSSFTVGRMPSLGFTQKIKLKEV